MSWRAFVVVLVILTAIAGAQFPAEKPSVDSGRAIFLQNCAGCHGVKGDGSGIGGAYNFTDDVINRSSAEFFASITNGRPKTAMPAFGARLTEAKRWDAIAYIWTFWADRTSTLIGKSIYEANCATCHGMTGDGSEISRGFAGKRPFDFTNLSTMASKRPSELFDGVTNGAGTEMPAWKERLSGDERWDAVRYAWTFQFSDYAVSPTPSTMTGIPPATGDLYKEPGGIAIIVISLAIAGAILYLFIRGLRER